MFRKLSKRTKLIALIFALGVVFLFGTVFTLAKTGVIHIKMLANPTTVNFYVQVKDSGGVNDLPAGTTVYAALPGQSGSPQPTQLFTVHNGYGYITRNLAVFSLYANTVYNFSTPCSSGTPNIATANSSSSAGSSALSPYVFSRTCAGGGNTSGTISIDGHVKDSQTQAFISGASEVLTGGNYRASTDSGGHYVISNITYADPSDVPNWQIYFSAPGYQSTSASLSSLGISAGQIVNGGTVYALAVGLKRDIPEYKITGNIKADNGNLLAEAEIKLIDKSTNPQYQYTRTTTATGGGTYSGKNYLSDKFQANSFDSAYLEISAAGYLPTEIKFLDKDVFTTTLISSGDNTFELKTVRDITLVKSVQDLYYKITTEACTDANRCPGRNSAGMVESISLVISGQTPQLSKNDFVPSALSGVFRSLPAATQTLYINASNNTETYVQAYLSKTLAINLSTVPLQNIPALGSVRVVEISLDKNPNYIPQNPTFDLQGLLKDENDKPVKANARVNCEDNSSCGNFGEAKSLQSGYNSTESNGIKKNYIFSGLYNIARPGSKIEKLILRIDKQIPPSYVDKNNNHVKDPEEDGVFEISRSDIKVINGKSVCDKSFKIRTIASSEARISGTVKAKDTSKPLVGVVKLSPINANGSIDATGEIIVNVASDGKYDFSGKINNINKDKQYWLTAQPNDIAYSLEMYSVYLNINPVIVVDFLLEKNIAGYVTFQGLVQNVSAGGSTQDIVGASVDLTYDGFFTRGFIDGGVTMPGTHLYKISDKSADIFGDQQTGTKKVVLTGKNGPSTTFNKHKSYKFELQAGRGLLIRRDFIFYPNDSVDALPKTKDVEITITSQLKEYRTVSVGPPSLVNKNAPTPLANIPVKLSSYRSDNQTGTSGIAVNSDEVKTDARGVARFPGWARQSSSIIVTIDSRTYSVVGGSNVFELSSNDAAKTINYSYTNWDPMHLQDVATKINMQQCDYNYPVSQFDSGSVCAAGCCLTSYSMAVKFYYSDKDDFRGQSAKQKMDPTVAARITNETGVSALLTYNGFPGISDQLNSRFGTKISTFHVSMDQADEYLKAGVPVVIHSEGLLSGDGHRHGGHCVLLIGKTSSGKYKIINPNSSPAIYELDKSDLGSIDYSFAVTTPESRAAFSSIKGTVSSNSIALAADGSTNARTDSDYVVSSKVTSNTVVPVEEVYLALIRPNTTDVYIKASKSGDNYTATIPEYLIVRDFSYKFLAVTSLDARIYSEVYPVKVDRIPSTPAIFAEKTWSRLVFQIGNARNNSSISATIASRLSIAYQGFRNRFSRLLQIMNINQSSLVSVSGQVLNASGQKVPKVLVKVWEDAALSEDGRFTIKNVRKGRVAVSVVDQATGKELVIKNPTITVNKATLGLNILVDDPQDLGTLNARVFASSIQSAYMTDTTTLKTGVLQLIRNGKIEKEINMATSAGKLSSLKLPVGTYSLKFIMNGKERRIITSNGSLTLKIQRDKLTNEILRVDDRSTFTLHISSQDGASDCNVYWWGHLYIASAAFGTSDWSTPPSNCTLNYTAFAGKYSLSFVDNYGYNRVIAPATIDVPAFLDGKVYEIKL